MTAGRKHYTFACRERSSHETRAWVRAGGCLTVWKGAALSGGQSLSDSVQSQSRASGADATSAGGGKRFPQDESRLLAALRAGDEGAFVMLVEQYHGSMLRLARAYVPTHEVAEEVVQETWLAVLEALDRFEARSSLKTWIFRILTTRAKTRGVREKRESVPPSINAENDPNQSAVDPSRFMTTGRFAGHWAVLPRAWEEDTPERLLLSKESRAAIERAIGALPETQRRVVILHDVEGLSPTEICNVLEISETNQRVLLHRGRSKVRRALEGYLEGEAGRG